MAATSYGQHPISPFGNALRLLTTLLTLAVALPATAQPTIFKCVSPEGQTTFQETACDTGVQSNYEYKNIGTPLPAPANDSLIDNLGVPTPIKRPTNSNTRSVAAGNEQTGLSLKQQKQCDRWHDEIEDISDKQRRGYTAEEGENQRRRMRRLKRSIARQHCPNESSLR